MHTGFAPDRLDRLDRMLEATVARGELAGIVTAVGHRGVAVHRGRYGFADLEAGRPMRDDTIFRMASMTKPITAVAMMILYEEARFDLNTPVKTIIPAFGHLQVCAGQNPGGTLRLEPLERDITIRHLFTHTSGLSYGWDETDPVDRAYQKASEAHPNGRVGMTLEGMTNLLAGMPLAFQPGTRFRYSLSIDVLGRIVEILSGQAFDVFLRERVFGPLGMVDTAFHVPLSKTDRVATLYDPPGPGGTVTPVPDQGLPAEPPSYPSPGGGLVSTIGDYTRFCRMMLGGGVLDGARVLGPTTVSLFSVNHTPEPALTDLQARDTEMEGFGCSLGCRVLLDVSRTGRYGSPGEFGWEGAFTTYFWVDPLESLYGIFLAQYSRIHFPIFRRFKQLTYQAMV